MTDEQIITTLGIDQILETNRELVRALLNCTGSLETLHRQTTYRNASQEWAERDVHISDARVALIRVGVVPLETAGVSP